MIISFLPSSVFLIIGSDHGVKAQGDGWLLTVALIEGSNIAAVDSSGFSDPYVVFSCNGKTRTSSIKFQKCDPMWNGDFHFLVNWVLFVCFGSKLLKPFSVPILPQFDFEIVRGYL